MMVGMRICDVDSCDRVHYAHGYCNAHWRRWRRNGQPGEAFISQKRPLKECSFDGCGRKSSVYGVCASHYGQIRNGKPLAVLQTRFKASARNDRGEKQCADCFEWFPESEYGKMARSTDGLMSRHKQCKRAYVIQRRYGVSLERYLELSANQGEVCAICGGVNESGRALAVDHSHACCSGAKACGECARDLLCSGCNIGIGQFRESASMLRAAALYLERHGVIDQKATP